MVEQSTNNIFENVYKFNGKELDESTGYYYYGARYYDPGASIFLSVDPLAEKYPGINPYTYVANNPINAIDPDGRDFRMITQRNSSGKIVNVSLHAVVYLQGSGASNEMATSLNSSFLNDYNNSRKVNGVTVSLNVTYVYDKNSVKNQKNLRGGENILKVRTDLPKSTSSFVEGSYNESKGIYRTGNTGEINSKSSNITRSTIHESMHFLGLSDRYDDFTGNHLNMGASKVTHPGFYDDIMGEGFNINDIHFENILNFSQENSNIKNSNSNGFEYSGNLKQLYDRASKRELYNGNKSNSSYHERSNQAN